MLSSLPSLLKLYQEPRNLNGKSLSFDSFTRAALFRITLALPLLLKTSFTGPTRSSDLPAPPKIDKRDRMKDRDRDRDRQRQRDAAAER